MLVTSRKGVSSVELHTKLAITPEVGLVYAAPPA